MTDKETIQEIAELLKQLDAAELHAIEMYAFKLRNNLQNYAANKLEDL